MGRYIHPPTLVEEHGRSIEPATTLAETKIRLEYGEHLVVVAQRGFGKVALVIETDADFRDATQDPRRLGFYMVGQSMADMAY
jgi:hypothetical protein